MRNHNIDTWNPEYGFKLTMSKRQMPLLSSHRYQLRAFLPKTFLHLWKRQKYSISFDVKTVTLPFVDFERSLKRRPTSQNVVCLVTVFSSEYMTLNVFW